MDHHHQSSFDLKIRVIRGNNLAVRDNRKGTSDPYVVIRMGKQKIKTQTKKKNLNPEWNEVLTLRVQDPKPMKLAVYDKDTFNRSDKIGVAEIDIKPFLEAIMMQAVEGRIIPSGTMITKVTPSQQNCLSKESCIFYNDGRIVQDMCLILKEVECGKIELQLQFQCAKENIATRYGHEDNDEAKEKKKSKSEKFSSVLHGLSHGLKKVGGRNNGNQEGEEEEEQEEAEEEEGGEWEEEEEDGEGLGALIEAIASLFE